MIVALPLLRYSYISEPIFRTRIPAYDLDVIFLVQKYLKYRSYLYDSLNPINEDDEWMYVTYLMIIFTETPPLFRKKFIDFQTTIHEDNIKWLYEVDTMMHDNSIAVCTEEAQECYSDFRKIIALKANELERNKNLIPIESEIIWQKSDTDLLELITALIQSGSINNVSKDLTRKDTIRLFETFFNCTIKDAENKLSKATARKIDQTPFLNTLTKSFKEYCDLKNR